MTARWRLGSRNPFTVYRVADGAHDVDHAREHFVTSFRREEDARRAVDAVNAQAGEQGPVGLDDLFTPIVGWAVVRPDGTVRDFVMETQPPAPTWYDLVLGALEGDEVRGLSLGAPPRRDDHGDPIPVTGEPAERTTPPSCDCPTTDGAEAAGSAVGQRGAPTWDVLVDCGRSGEDTCSASHEHIDHRVGHPASAERGRDSELHERVVLAFRWAYAVTVRSVDGAYRTDIEWRQPSRTEAERMADVALAALRDGGEDTGGEDTESSYTEQVAARVRAALGADPVNEAILCDLSRAVHQVHDDLDEAMSWHRRELQRVGIALTGLMLRIDHTSGDGRRWVTVEADPETGEPLTTEHHRIAESVATHALDETRTRLATALGVSLDPDDPDPVGRLVEAAGKAREVEVVSGAEAAKLPEDSIVVQADEDGEPLPESSRYPARTIGYLDDDERTDLAGWPDARVLYRAPAPAPAALTVGELVHDARDLDRRASVGTIVDDGARVGRRKITAWAVTGLDGPVTSRDLAYPVTVVRTGSDREEENGG